MTFILVYDFEREREREREFSQSTDRGGWMLSGIKPLTHKIIIFFKEHTN